MFKRHMVREGGMIRPSAAGDGLAANFNVALIESNANLTLTVPQVLGGLILAALTLTANRTYTLPTAVALAAAMPDMNTGDAYSFVVTNGQAAANDIIIGAGVGITVKGTNNYLSASPKASTVMTLVMTDDTAGAETFDLY